MGRRSDERPTIAPERTIEAAIMAGVIAAAPMMLFAMVVSGAFQGRGFFTPAYHVAFIIDPNTMPTSLKNAAAGDTFYLLREPFLFGLSMHVAVGAVYGLLFGLIARTLRLSGRPAFAAALVYSVIVMVFMAFVVLPVAGDVFNAGRTISEMPTEQGWAVFVLQHAIYGLGLGLWLKWRPQDIGLAPAVVQGGAPSGP